MDKFHIQRMANGALEAVRKGIRQNLSQRRRLKLKDERFLLLKRKRAPSDEAQKKMQGWLEQFPQLAAAHVLKESFLEIRDHDARASAESAYTAYP